MAHFALSFLFMLWCITSCARGYGYPGAVERVMFYYAYLMDVEAHGGTPKKISTGCGKIMGTGGNKPCSFDQFVNYIQGARNGSPGQVSITKQPYDAKKPPALAETANLAVNSQATGQITEGRVIQLPKPKISDAMNQVPDPSKDEPTPYDSLLRKVCGYGADLAELDSVSQELKTGFKDSMKAVLIARMDATTESFRKAKTAQGRKVSTKQIPIFPDNPDSAMATTLDDKAYRNDNNLSKDEVIREWEANREGGHKGNVKALRDGLKQLEQDC